MQTAVIATGCLSVRLSVCLSVTLQCFVQMNEDRAVFTSGRTVILVSEEVKFILIFQVDHPQ